MDPASKNDKFASSGGLSKTIDDSSDDGKNDYDLKMETRRKDSAAIQVSQGECQEDIIVSQGECQEDEATYPSSSSSFTAAKV